MRYNQKEPENVMTDKIVETGSDLHNIIIILFMK